MINFFIFFFFFFSVVVFAAESKVKILSEAALAYRNKQGTEDALIIGKSSDAYFFNGYRIPADKVKKQDKDLKNVFTMSAINKDPKTCHSGSFVHTITEGQNLSKESGCISDPRYRELSASFRKLR